LTSLFRFRPEIWSLGILREPAVRISGDTVSVLGRIATANLPAEPEIEQIRAFLPDSADVEVSGTVRPLSPTLTVLEVGSIEVAGMPIPAPFYSPVIDRLSPAQQESLPPGTFALLLPPGIASIRAEGGDLVITR